MSTIILHTSSGDIKLKLTPEKTPKTVANFLEYATSGFYNNTIFHRVIKDFMIQGGGLTADLQEKETHPSIQNEAKNGLQNKTGSIAMARTSDPHSASSQFFINVADNHFLDFKSETTDGFGYCVFGEVIEGLEHVMEISEVQTGSKQGYDDVPLQSITLISIERHISIVHIITLAYMLMCRQQLLDNYICVLLTTGSSKII